MPDAIRKGIEDAKKHLIKVSLREPPSPRGYRQVRRRTCAHEARGSRYRRYRRRRVRAVVAAGIKDIRTKALRSNNPCNVVSATMDGLAQLRTAEQAAAVRGRTAKKSWADVCKDLSVLPGGEVPGRRAAGRMSFRRYAGYEIMFPCPVRAPEIGARRQTGARKGMVITMAKKAKANGVQIKLVHSLIGRKKDQIATAQSLGLRKIGDCVSQPLTTEATKGKVAKIIHLVEVTEA